MEARVHEWRIAERECARQEERRGRRHAFETLEPARTALLVIDMVPFFVTESAYCQGIAGNLSAIADALRAAGGTVAWVVPADEDKMTSVSEEFYGPNVADLFRRSGGTGPVRERLWAGFEVHPQDLLPEKSAASAFFPGRCPMPAQLQERDISTVLITGTVTTVCCESSARDASTLGYRVIMVADGNAAPSDEVHNATLHTIYRTFGDVRPTTEVLAMIKSAGRDATG